MKYRVFYGAQIQIVSSEPPSRIDISFPDFLLISFFDSRKKERKKKTVGEGDDDVPCITKCCTIRDHSRKIDLVFVCKESINWIWYIA